MSKPTQMEYDSHMRELSTRMLDAADEEPAYNVCFAAAALIAFTLDVTFQGQPRLKQRQLDEIVKFMRNVMKEKEDA